MEKSTKPISNSDQSSPRTSGASDSIDDPAKAQSLPIQEPFSVHSSKQSSELDFSGSPLDGGQQLVIRALGNETNLIRAVPFQSPTFSYQGMPDSSHWGSTSFLGNQQLPEDPNTPQSATDFWPQQQPPGSAIFQHRGSIPVGLDQSAFFLPPSETGPTWGSMRSMSVGDVSQMPHLQQFQHTYRHLYQHSNYPYPFPDGSNSSLPMVSSEREQSLNSSAPHILPSQTFPQGWTAFTQPEQPAPILEQPQGLFGRQWYSEPGQIGSVEETIQGTTDESAFISATHPG